jgi:hypothetical protein
MKGASIDTKAYTKEIAVDRLKSNGIKVEGSIITISKRRTIGLKLRSAVDYLVTHHKFYTSTVA